MGTTTTTYADAVRRALDDLPAARYLELVDGLDEHLAEVQAEADGSLVDTLGPPEAYAAELRASAGLPPRAGAGAPLPPPVAPPVTVPASPAAPARRPIDRGRLARIALAGVGLLAAWWVLAASELTVPKLVLIALGVLGATWVARRLLTTATLPDRTSRRVSATIAVGGLAAAAAFGSAQSERRIYVPYDNPPVTLLPGQGTVALPDFRGASGADAAQVARELGLDVVLDGVGEVEGDSSTVVVAQDPPADTPLAPGSKIRLVVAPATSLTTAPSASVTTVYLGPITVPSAVPSISPTTIAVTLPPVTNATTSAPATTLAPATTAAPATAGPSTSLAG